MIDQLVVRAASMRRFDRHELIDPRGVALLRHARVLARVQFVCS